MSQRRLFFALPCSDTEKTILARWRETHLEDVRARWVPAANLHLTLVFLGGVDEETLPSLLALGDAVEANAFRLHLTRFGQWGRGKVVWLAPEETPAALSQLVDTLNQGLARLELPTDERAYRPHLTLARKSHARQLPDLAPDIELSVDRFALFESVPGGRGVHYEALREWPLG